MYCRSAHKYTGSRLTYRGVHTQCHFSMRCISLIHFDLSKITKWKENSPTFATIKHHKCISSFWCCSLNLARQLVPETCNIWFIATAETLTDMQACKCHMSTLFILYQGWRLGNDIHLFYIRDAGWIFRFKGLNLISGVKLMMRASNWLQVTITTKL